VLYIGNHLIKAKPDEISSVYSIKAGTKTIANSAFSYCDSLTSITIPKSVTYLGKNALKYSPNLAEVIISRDLLLRSKDAFDEALYEKLVVRASVD
jgi:hypothetical protein